MSLALFCNHLPHTDDAFSSTHVKASWPPIMYPRFPMSSTSSSLFSEQNVLLNLLHGMVLPEEDLEVLRQMVGRNTTKMPAQQNGVANFVRPRLRSDDCCSAKFVEYAYWPCVLSIPMTMLCCFIFIIQSICFTNEKGVPMGSFHHNIGRCSDLHQIKHPAFSAIRIQKKNAFSFKFKISKIDREMEVPSWSSPPHLSPLESTRL